MKKTILLIVTIFTISYSIAQESESYYPVSNTLKQSGQIDENGFAIGEWKYYLESGILEYNINYTTKISKKYYATGELKEKGTFNPDTGAHIGEWNTFYKNGNIKTKGINNEDGNKNGKFSIYFENGSIDSCEIYLDGVKQQCRLP